MLRSSYQTDLLRCPGLLECLTSGQTSQRRMSSAVTRSRSKRLRPRCSCERRPPSWAENHRRNALLGHCQARHCAGGDRMPRRCSSTMTYLARAAGRAFVDSPVGLVTATENEKAPPGGKTFVVLRSASRPRSLFEQRRLVVRAIVGGHLRRFELLELAFTQLAQLQYRLGRQRGARAPWRRRSRGSTGRSSRSALAGVWRARSRGG